MNFSGLVSVFLTDLVMLQCFGDTVGDYQFEYQGSSVQQAASGQSEKTLVNMALSVAHFHPTIIAAPSVRTNASRVSCLCSYPKIPFLRATKVERSSAFFCQNSVQICSFSELGGPNCNHVIG